ncbi:MAG TPA: nucleoside triphosphate pyrophosphohydrolase [Syntrophorhabdaceae bacterium]|nr:nucleoside triphosphate pyrophosphohydrolase [Syntrophorhabdaceae bacterium]HOL05047.1 nucleoside triphosphate pyrophosphohydrolase [Syntrophorhabdaceae bacterium]HON85373.1 nucleoside triphosphate pyrophosphohydrolase [Syntrophorhabdaceae bacterium]HOT41607.1 nucleoside triphosphate pyrophosphohydrolase [Syntrophorhabdaceae bacterium]HPC66954.1 nucleoside triphosphate pyrophosphohydrolase [Syntrophorhabdaceae bacterium]
MEEFSRLVELMETLRSDRGCKWDRKQTVHSFKTYVLEEAYELIDAIEKEDYEGIKEELGDLLFHIIFISQICREKSLFDIKDVISLTYKKMFNRHPHVFIEKNPDIPIEVRWEEIKKAEKEDYSPLSDIPKILPALLRAYIITRRAAKVGFDWKNVRDIHEKLEEEIRELQEAEKSDNKEKIKEEIGDILFTVVNISRSYNIDPEDALRFTSDKFVRRFGYIEKNTELGKSDIAVMDKLWDEIKSMEKEGD